VEGGGDKGQGTAGDAILSLDAASVPSSLPSLLKCAQQQWRRLSLLSAQRALLSLRCVVCGGGRWEGMSDARGAGQIRERR